MMTLTKCVKVFGKFPIGQRLLRFLSLLLIMLTRCEVGNVVPCYANRIPAFRLQSEGPPRR